ncbi:MAG: hypothetical protein ACLFR2_06675 [Candidatus Kapaibacterium sp.]
MLRKGGLILFLPLIMLINLTARAEESREEAIFSVRYLRHVNDYFVYIQGVDKAYVPFEEVISFLNIYYTRDDNYKFEGYMNRADSAFVIDFNNNNIVDIEGNSHSIDKSSWFIQDMILYADAGIFEKAFLFDVKMNYNKLTLTIDSGYELPLQRSMRVSYVSNNFQREETVESFGPMISGRSFNIINGGILDYSLGGNKNVSGTSYNFSGRLGLEVLGGEFQYQGTGSVNSGEFKDYQERFRWNYRFDKNWLYSLSAGDLLNLSTRNSGSRGYRIRQPALRGLQLTNEDLEIPNYFTEYIIEDHIEPDWTVEVYLEGRLYEVKKTDLDGYYRFEIPLTYGLTNISLKYYGPKGEYKEEEDVLNIPSSLLKAGEVKYSIAAGEDINAKIRQVDGSLSLGLSDWLTGTVSFNKKEAEAGYTFVSQSYINLFNLTMLQLTYANEGIYQASMKLDNLIHGVNSDVSFISYDRSISSQYSNHINSIEIYTNMNRLFSLPVTLTTFGSYNNFVSSGQGNLSSSLMLNLGSINAAFRHTISLSLPDDAESNIYQNFNLGAGYYFSKIKGGLSFINNTRLNADIDFDPVNVDLHDIAVNIEKRIFHNISMISKYNYNFRSKMSNVSMGLNLNLDNLRSRSSAIYSENSGMAYNSSVSGSLEFDSRNLRFALSNSTAGPYGKSSAAVKFYMDNNNNGKLDQNEELIQDIDFSITKGANNKQDIDNYKIITGLKPGEKYNIKVKPESLPDPSIIPRHMEFSFVAEPYSYKSIEIPCIQGGVIEGTTFREVAGKIQPQAGLKVHIEGLDNDFYKTISVFSDGSFFYVGIPPGRYHIYVDSLQQEILKCATDPYKKEIEVNAVENGDYIAEIDFTLFSKDKKEGQKLAGQGITGRHGGDADLESREWKKLVIFYEDNSGAVPQKFIDKIDMLGSMMADEESLTLDLRAYPEDANSNSRSHKKLEQRIEGILATLDKKGVDRKRIAIHKVSPDKKKRGRYPDYNIEEVIELEIIELP